MKKLTHIILLFSCLLQAQQDNDITQYIGNLQAGFSVGNACDENELHVVVYGDLELNAEQLEVMKAFIEVQGEILLFGEPITEDDDEFLEYITFRCGEMSIIQYYDNTLSVEEVESNKIGVYPTLVKDKLYIIKEALCKLLIYDEVGRLVLKMNYPKRAIAIDCSNLVKGLYVVKLISDNKIETVKIIKL